VPLSVPMSEHKDGAPQGRPRIASEEAAARSASRRRRLDSEHRRLVDELVKEKMEREKERMTLCLTCDGEAKINTRNDPCGHDVQCEGCANTFRERNGEICPVCREESSLIVFRSVDETFECQLCLEDFDLVHRFESSPVCGHVFCVQCMVDYFRNALSDRTSGMISGKGLKCPEECESSSSVSRVRTLLRMSEQSQDENGCEGQSFDPLKTDELFKFEQVVEDGMIPVTRRFYCSNKEQCGRCFDLGESKESKVPDDSANRNTAGMGAGLPMQAATWWCPSCTFINRGDGKETRTTCAICRQTRRSLDTLSTESLSSLIEIAGLTSTLPAGAGRIRVLSRAKAAERVLAEAGPPKNKGSQLVVCPFCETVSCRECGEAAHTGKTCSEHRCEHEGTDDMTRAYIEATSKPCPQCGTRTTHWHGHECHHISPGSGCPNCQTHWCFSCGGAGSVAPGHCPSVPKCPLFCRPVRGTVEEMRKDIEDNLDWSTGFPVDRRCGCAICPNCKPNRPCETCRGRCVVCRGIIAPGPQQLILPESREIRSARSSWSEQERARATALLFEAAKAGRVREVQECLANGADVNVSKGRDVETPLCWASYNGHTAVVELLLARRDIDVNKADSGGITPLNEASFNGHTTVVELLLARGDIDVNKANTNGWTPLLNTIQEGHTEVVELLLAHRDIDVNKATTKGSTPLYMASQEGHPEVVELLLARGDIDVNNAKTTGATPLFIASQEGHTAVVEMLLARGDIDVNKAETRYGATPLFMASARNHTAVVELLLARGDIDVNKARTTDGATPLYIASSRNHTEVVQLLLARRDIDVNKARTNGVTPLNAASKKGHTAVVEMLLARGDIDVNKAETRYGATPLNAASQKGHTAIVELLRAHQ